MKSKKIVSIIVAAIILAIAAGVLVYFYLSGQKTTIYVFNNAYSAGTVVTDDMLTPIQVDATIVKAGNTTDTATEFVTTADKQDLIDRQENSLRIDVSEDMPLVSSMLTSNSGNYLEQNMDSSKVAVTVPVTSVSGVTDELGPGSKVNIYASGYQGNTETTLIFENMRVLSVQKDEDGELTSATIEVSVDESVKLIDAANNSTLYFGLVNGSGYQATGKSNLTYNAADDTTNNTNGNATEKEYTSSTSKQ